MEKIEKFNQIIDEVYEQYWNSVETSEYDGFGSTLIKLPTLSQEQFINKCKTDNEFSEKWGLKIEERELSLEERHQISLNRIGHDGIADRDNITWHETYNKTGIPTKIITLTHNNETAITYE